MAGFDPSTASLEDDDKKPAAPAGFDVSTAQLQKPAGVIRRIAGDMIATPLAQGIVGVPEAAVGVADLVTGGRAGKAAEELGFRPREAKQIIGDALYSDEQQDANRRVAQADGFLPTLQAAIENPSTIVRTAVESVPAMLAGGAISRIARAAAPGLAPVTAGAAGEAVVAAGAGAEQLRQETPDGLLTPEQAGLMAASGAITGVISRIAGKAAGKLGIADPETALATGSLKPVAGEAAEAAAKKGVARRIGEGFVTEGVLEELPQSMQEQVFQNLAQGKPWNEGVGSAGAMGLLAGGLTGGVVGGLTRPGEPPPPSDKPLLLGYDENADQLIGYPDGSVARRSEVETYLAGLAKDPAKQMAERARLLGVNPVPAWEQPGAQPYSPGAPPEPHTSDGTPPGGEPPAGAGPAGTAAAPPPAPMGPIARAAMVAPPPETLPKPQPKEGEGGKKGEDGKDAVNPGPSIPAAPVDPAGGPISRAAALAQQQGIVAPTQPSKPVTGPVTAPVTPVTQAAPAAPAAPMGPAAAAAGAQPVTGNAGSASAQPAPDAQASPAVPRETVEFEPKPGEIIVDEHFEAGHGRAATSPVNQRSEPTEGQKEAENYAVGRTRVGGLGVSIENAQGTVRRGVDPDGRDWETTMRDHYGRLLGTIGADSTPQKRQHLDVFIKPGTPKSWRGTVFVVDTRKRGGGGFDEHKIMFGATDEADARRMFARNYDDGEARIGAVSGTPFDQFKEWAYDGTQKKDPFSPAFAPVDDRAAGFRPETGVVPDDDGGVAGAPDADGAPSGQPEARGEAAAPAAAPVGRRTGARAARAASYDKNPLLTFLATHGLYHAKGDPKSLKREFSPDRQVSVPGYHVAVFRRDGKQVDELVQLAIEDGYLPADGTADDLYRLIERAMRGQRVIPQYAEGAIEREVDARTQAQREEAEAALAELSDEELAVIDESEYDAVPDVDAPSNVPMEAAMRALGFTDEEIANALRAEKQPAPEPADAAAPPAGGQGRPGPGQAAGQGGPPAGGQREAAPQPEAAVKPAPIEGGVDASVVDALGRKHGMELGRKVGSNTPSKSGNWVKVLGNVRVAMDLHTDGRGATLIRSVNGGRSGVENRNFTEADQLEAALVRMLQPAEDSLAPAPAPAPAAAPRDDTVVELRKQLSVLRKLRACVAGK